MVLAGQRHVVASTEGFAAIQSKPDAQARECDRYATGAGPTTTMIDWCAACVGHSNRRSPSLARFEVALACFSLKITTRRVSEG